MEIFKTHSYFQYIFLLIYHIFQYIFLFYIHAHMKIESQTLYLNGEAMPLNYNSSLKILTSEYNFE